MPAQRTSLVFLVVKNQEKKGIFTLAYQVPGTLYSFRTWNVAPGRVPGIRVSIVIRHSIIVVLSTGTHHIIEFPVFVCFARGYD